MKSQDLEEKLDIMSENIWISQQKNGNYKKRKQEGHSRKQSTLSDMKTLLYGLSGRWEIT